MKNTQIVKGTWVSIPCYTQRLDLELSLVLIAKDALLSQEGVSDTSVASFINSLILLNHLMYLSDLRFNLILQFGSSYV